MACIGRVGRAAIGAVIGAGLGAAVTHFFPRIVGANPVPPPGLPQAEPTRQMYIASLRKATIWDAVIGGVVVGGVAAIPKPKCTINQTTK